MTGTLEPPDDGTGPDSPARQAESAQPPATPAALIPAMPVIGPGEWRDGSPYPLSYGLGPTIGWQDQPEAQGGPVFMILVRSAPGSLNVAERFPLTEDGWAQAWEALVARSPDAADEIRAVLMARVAARASRARDDTGPASPSLAAPSLATPPAAPTASTRAKRIVAVGALVAITALCGGIAFVFEVAVQMACQSYACANASGSNWGHFEIAQLALFAIALAGIFFRNRSLLATAVTIGIAGQFVALAAFLTTLPPHG